MARIKIIVEIIDEYLRGDESCDELATYFLDDRSDDPPYTLIDAEWMEG